MSNHYFQAVITPSFPEGFFTKLELAFLKEVGVNIHKDGNFHIRENCDFETIEVFNFHGEVATNWSIYDVLQQALVRQDNIPEIIIHGAFICDRFGTGGFGGLVIRITKDSIQEASTYDLVRYFRNNPEETSL